MKYKSILAVLLLLSACGTPQQRCIRTASNPVQGLLNAIQTADTNIVRGYAVHTSQESYQVTDICYDSYKKPYSCLDTRYRTIETPVAIDVAEERRKIAILKSRLPAAQRKMDADIAICRANFPR